MAKSAVVLTFTRSMRSRILKEVDLTALGNTDRSMRNIAVDLIKSSNLDYSVIADGCYLHKKTIENLGEDITVSPHNETIERIYKYFAFSIKLHTCCLKEGYQLKAKI